MIAFATFSGVSGIGSGMGLARLSGLFFFLSSSLMLIPL